MTTILLILFLVIFMIAAWPLHPIRFVLALMMLTCVFLLTGPDHKVPKPAPVERAVYRVAI